MLFLTPYISTTVIITGNLSADAIIKGGFFIKMDLVKH